MGADWTLAARAENLHYALGWFTADVPGAHLIYQCAETGHWATGKFYLSDRSKADVRRPRDFRRP